MAERDHRAVVRAEELHREVAARAAAADQAGVTHEDLLGVRQRLLEQQIRFRRVADQQGMPPPLLAPSPEEITAALPVLGDASPAAVAGAVSTMSSLLDRVDVTLTELLTTREAEAVDAADFVTAHRGRNSLIYGAFALLTLLAQVVVLGFGDETKPWLTLPLALVVFPVVAWLAALATITYLFRGTGPVSTTSRLGAVICFLPNLLLCCWLGALVFLEPGS